MSSKYFDNASTTPMDPRVLEAMLPYLRESFGNAHSLHHFGTEARAAVEKAREQVAALMHAEDPSQIFFTSGATEANNWVLNSFAGGFISPFEHSSVREPAIWLGFQNLENRNIELELPGESVSLISVMAVNNEVGFQLDIGRFRPLAEKLHSDVTQAAGKIDLDLSLLDYASLSAHKFYGPKGVGALYVQDDPPEAFLIGGGQEHGARGGTLNVPSIVGMGAAAQIAIDEREANWCHVSELREAFLAELETNPADCEIHDLEPGVPHILALSFRELEAQPLVVELDRLGYAVGAGAACSSESTEPSHVLLALDVEQEWIGGTIRVSFGRTNTKEATIGLANAVNQSIAKLRNLR